MSIFENNLKIILETAVEIDEIHEDYRKGIGQSKYILEIKDNAQYYNIETDEFCDVQKELVGYWMMSPAEDLSRTALKEAIKECNWVKCKEQEVTTTEWVEL